MALIIGMTLMDQIYSAEVDKAVSEMRRTTAIVEGLKDALLSVRQARVQAWVFVATDDKSALKARDDAFDQFHKQYAEVETHIVSPTGRQLVKDFAEAAGSFEVAAKALDALKANGATQTAPEFIAAIANASSTAKRYAETNDKAAQFYKDRADLMTTTAANDLRSSNRISLAVGAVATLLGLVIAWVIARGIATPIKAMTGAMAALAAGDLDVAIPAAANTDEIGDMAKAVDVFKRNAGEARRLAEHEALETAAKAQRAERIVRDTDAFDGASRQALAALASAADEMRATAGSLNAGADEASQRSTAVAAAAEQASSNVQTVASASEELSASIAEINRRVAQSSEIASQAVREGDETRSAIASLHEASQKIGAVVRLISDIASQTNLLALNATIEASRAGDAGKGFAVVASEVKTLASQTAKATEEIGAQITAMQAATNDAVAAIERINTTIERMSEISTTIASAMEEQGAATQEISRNVQQAAHGTQEVTQNIAAINRSVNEASIGSNLVLATAVRVGEQTERLRGEVSGFQDKIRAA
ncbi:MAG TPA: methyl-accepting chemotaxis protein [Aliidongia sp.]|nr:methyl-accepting chemotaxis protein [Aliidongia sp.]